MTLFGLSKRKFSCHDQALSRAIVIKGQFHSDLQNLILEFLPCPETSLNLDSMGAKRLPDQPS